MFIPKFALHLEEKLRDVQDIDPAKLIVEMHTSGINVRLVRHPFSAINRSLKVLWINRKLE